MSEGLNCGDFASCKSSLECFFVLRIMRRDAISNLTRLQQRTAVLFSYDQNHHGPPSRRRWPTPTLALHTPSTIQQVHTRTCYTLPSIIIITSDPIYGTLRMLLPRRRPSTSYCKAVFAQCHIKKIPNPHLIGLKLAFLSSLQSLCQYYWPHPFLSCQLSGLDPSMRLNASKVEVPLIQSCVSLGLP